MIAMNVRARRPRLLSEVLEGFAENGRACDALIPAAILRPSSHARQIKTNITSSQCSISQQSKCRTRRRSHLQRRYTKMSPKQMPSTITGSWTPSTQRRLSNSSPHLTTLASFLSSHQNARSTFTSACSGIWCCTRDAPLRSSESSVRTDALCLAVLAKRLLRSSSRSVLEWDNLISYGPPLTQPRLSSTQTNSPPSRNSPTSPPSSASMSIITTW